MIGTHIIFMNTIYNFFCLDFCSQTKTLFRFFSFPSLLTIITIQMGTSRTKIKTIRHSIVARDKITKILMTLAVVTEEKKKSFSEFVICVRLQFSCFGQSHCVHQITGQEQTLIYAPVQASLQRHTRIDMFYSRTYGNGRIISDSFDILLAAVHFYYFEA